MASRAAPITGAAGNLEAGWLDGYELRLMTHRSPLPADLTGNFECPFFPRKLCADAPSLPTAPRVGEAWCSFPYLPASRLFSARSAPFGFETKSGSHFNKYRLVLHFAGLL
jgi:hypothetical protein